MILSGLFYHIVRPLGYIREVFPFFSEIYLLEAFALSA